MSNNLLSTLTYQLKNLNLPNDQIQSIMSQATSHLGNMDLKNMAPEAIQNQLGSILKNNNLSPDIIGNIMANISKDGFQITDITNAFAQNMVENNIKSVADKFGLGSMVDQFKGGLGGLFGK